ncbi:hypothetical protein [Metallumcola ferriviriculae]
MIEQLVMKNQVYWRGSIKELLPYLRELGKTQSTVQEFINKNLA